MSPLLKENISTFLFRGDINALYAYLVHDKRPTPIVSFRLQKYDEIRFHTNITAFLV